MLSNVAPLVPSTFTVQPVPARAANATCEPANTSDGTAMPVYPVRRTPSITT
jgi:hypothetical protein